MTRTNAGALTLAALLAASTATGAWAQATDDGQGDQAQTEQTDTGQDQPDAGQAAEGQADQAPTEGGAEEQPAEQPQEDQAQGGGGGTEPETEQAAEEATTEEADVTVIQEGEEEAPAEDEAEVVVEEDPADVTVITTDPAAEGEATVVEEAPAEGEATVVEEAPAEDEAVAVEETEVEVETPVEGQIFEQSADQLLGSTLLDTSVASPDGETIGDVEDMVISSDGQITGVVIGVGGFLGIGEKRVAMEFDRIQVQPQEGGDLLFVLDATREQLEAAPEFQTQADLEAEQPAD